MFLNLKIETCVHHSLEFINADAIKDETNPGAKSDIYRLEATFIQCPFKDVCPIIHIAGGLSVWRNLSRHRLSLFEKISRNIAAKFCDPRVRGI